MFETSRSLAAAHPKLVRRWRWLLEQYARRYPADPLPQISCTYRDMIDQDAAVARGASQLTFPHSTHNYEENGARASLALDFFFTEDGKTSYRAEWMERVCNLAEEAGLFSGRQWGFDRPHVALVEKVGQWPKALPPLPTALPENAPVFVFNAPEATVYVGSHSDDILIRIKGAAKVDASFAAPVPATPVLPEAVAAVQGLPAPRVLSLTSQGVTMPIPARYAQQLSSRVTRASDSTPNYTADEKEPVTKYVAIIGNLVAAALSVLIALGLVNLTDLQAQELVTTITATVTGIYAVITAVTAAIARDKTYSEATVDKLLADQKEALKSGH